MANFLVQNLKRYEIDTPAPCGLVRAARAEIEELRKYKFYAEKRFVGHGMTTLSQRFRDYPEQYPEPDQGPADSPPMPKGEG